MQRLYFALDLDDDPAAIAEYESWHRPDRIWPEIVTQLRAAGIHELEIFRCGNRLVMVKQVPEGSSDHDPALLEDNGRTQEWEQLMWRFQRPLPCADAGEKWVPMARIFSLRQTLGEEKP
jgi:L-rhamnose mutarotase